MQEVAEALSRGLAMTVGATKLRRVRRVAAIVMLSCAGLLAPLFVFGSAVMNERAMNRCTMTPPGFPKRLSRAGIGITVETRLVPPGVTCVYHYKGRVIAKRPPASAA